MAFIQSTETLERVVHPTELLTHLENLYWDFLRELGYAARREFLDEFHPIDVLDRVVDRIIRELRKKIGKDEDGNNIIKNRYASRGYDGGYFIGDLSQHRNEPGNLVAWNGYSLNTVTGVLILPAGKKAYLTPFESELMFWIIRAGERSISSRFLAMEVYRGGVEPRPIDVRFAVKRLNQRAGENIVVSGGYGTESYRLRS